MDQTWRMDLRGFSAHVVIVFLAGTAPAAIGQDANMTRADTTFVQAIAKADRAALEKLLDADSSLAPAEKQKLVKNIDTVRMANNRRVDVTLSTTGQSSVKQFPFNAADSLFLIGGREVPKKPMAKPGVKKAPAKKKK